MYSEKHIIEMVDSYNCLRLDNKHVFQVEVYEDPKDKQKFFELGNKKIPFKNLRVGQLAELIAHKGKFEADKSNLWKVDVDKSKLNPGSTKEDIEKLGGELMEFEHKFERYFKADYELTDNIHIVAVVATTTTAGPFQQGVPQVTSIEGAMTKILEGILVPMDVDNVNNVEPKSKSMALKQRDLKQAIDVIDKNFRNALDKIEPTKRQKNINPSVAEPPAKTKYRILLCGGAPGIGKTRYGIELFNCLNKEWNVSGIRPYVIYMLLDFTNGYALDEHEIQGDMKNASEIILGLRLAYYHFVSGKYAISFDVFRTKANGYKELFKLDNVLMHIYNHEYKSLQSGQRLFIFLQIDEFQLIYKDRKDGSKLFQQLIRTLGHHMTGKIHSNIFVQTLFSGTAPQDAIRAMEPTMYSCEPLDLPLLSLESRLDIMREFATSENVPDHAWVPQIWIHQLLLDTGGLPRALDYLFTEFFGEKFTNIKEFFENLEKRVLVPSTIYNNVANNINKAYHIQTYARDHRTLVYELIYRNIMVIESDISDELQDGDSTIKLEHLERDRHLILRKLEGKDKVLIDIPYFFMYLYANVLGIFTENLSRAFLPDSDLLWQDWEVFIADFIASRIMIHHVLEKDTLKLKNFFCGALGSDVTLNLLIKFEPVKIYKLKHRFPCLDLSAKGGETAKLEPGYMMINGYSAPFADVFFLVDNPEPILIAIQCRKRQEPLNLKTIEDEHEKNLNISKKMKEKAKKLRNDAKIKSREMEEKLQNEAKQYTQLADFLSKYRIVTIFITTQHSSEELVEYLPNDCILIYQENFDVFFGPVFSSRTKLVITRDSNPNLSTASELTSRFEAIKEDIGDKIEKTTRKRKTIRSHEEFCEEFPELADDDEIRNNLVYYPYHPHIEPFEYSNKKARV